MSKRFTYRDDHFIVAYLGTATSRRQIGIDLGRSEKSISARATKLRKTGAWDAILRIEKAQREYLACLGADEYDQQIATLAT